MAGVIADRFGYDTAFLFLAAMALLAFLLFWLGVPETGGHSRRAATAASEPPIGAVPEIIVGRSGMAAPDPMG